MSKVKINLCQNEELGLSCMGCCGHDYTSRKEIEKGLYDNTISFLECEDKKEWGSRFLGYIQKCGICYNLVKVGDEVFCPLHPLRNEGQDLRDDFCEIDYRCKAMFMFEEEWDDKTKKEFLKFLKSKELDWYTYSIGMDNNSFLNEFLKKNIKKSKP